MSFKKQIIPKLEIVAWITICWTLVSILYFLIGYDTLSRFDSELSEFKHTISFRTNIISGLLAGIIGGSAVIFLWEDWLRTKKYGSAIKHILISYTIIYYFISLCAVLFFQAKTNHLYLTDKELWVLSLNELIEFNSIIPYLFWLVVVIITMIMLLVNDKYGPGVFKKFLLGKYFEPTREERIFMFLDLRSSTTIAEKLGESKYFNFLKDVFKYSTPPILNFKGEIYQYVGDEIVISWPLKNGLENQNCINCFFEIQKVLDKKNFYFKDHYGIMPEFKAGLHTGKVMTGEIGLVKREIAFSGDVLNTTARIQSKCNDFKVNILLSKDLINLLDVKILKIKLTELGQISLKGKSNEVSLYTCA
ncbi:MAG: adenylate/guanylate cyclase domain-containing protein [Bacteroidota bacterium]